MDLQIQDLTLKYGDTVAVDGLDLEVGDGESVVLLGESGCGKTTTMRCVAGLEEPTKGTISIGHSKVYGHGTNVPASQRNIGMVFQSYAIWPHKTVFENIAFPLRMRREKKEVRKKKVKEVLELVGMEDLMDRNASKLSGGQMQRVALARSIVMRPSILLLDEPLSNLDARLRDRLRSELRSMQLSLGLTTLYVTHDQSEAISLADRIAVLQKGRIVQQGTPEDIYERPESGKLADFLGVSNVLDCEQAEEGLVRLTNTSIKLRVGHLAPGKNTKLCIRRENVRIFPPTFDADSASQNIVPGIVTRTDYQGSTTVCWVEIAQGVEIECLIPIAESHDFRPTRDAKVSVELPPKASRVVPGDVV